MIQGNGALEQPSCADSRHAFLGPQEQAASERGRFGVAARSSGLEPVDRFGRISLKHVSAREQETQGGLSLLVSLAGGQAVKLSGAARRAIHAQALQVQPGQTGARLRKRWLERQRAPVILGRGHVGAFTIEEKAAQVVRPGPRTSGEAWIQQYRLEIGTRE